MIQAARRYLRRGGRSLRSGSPKVPFPSHWHTLLSMSSGVAEGIDLLLSEPNLDRLVVAYFDSEGPFAGHTFDTLGENPTGDFTVSDLLAVTLLDVVYSPPAVRELLGHTSFWSPLLAAVPDNLPLWDIADDSYRAADMLWRALMGLPGVGPTKAGKLLARKRPALLPIFDDVIGTFLAPDARGLWWELSKALQDSDRRNGIDSLACAADFPVTTLRALDVAIWMRCSNSMNARSARVMAELPAEPLVR